jgi:PAS domain S-box-containing protein
VVGVSLNEKSVIRSASFRKSVGGVSNGNGSARSSSRNNRHRKWPSSVKLERASQRAQIEELQARLRWYEEERDRISWLFEAVPIGYVLMDEHGNIKEFNQQLEKTLGFRRGVLVNGPLTHLIFPADMPTFLEHLRRCKHSNKIVSSEIRLRNGGTQGLPVEMVSLPPRHGSTGPPLYRTAILDLTNRRATEQKLADTLQSFGTLLDTLEGIVWEADSQTLDVTFVSRYAEEMLGYPRSQWFQPGFWERHIYVDDREQVMQEVSRALREQTHVTVDYRVFTADRRLLWIHDRIGVRAHHGKVKLLGIAVDMTAQKETEKELEKERANLEQRVAERTAQLQTTISELEAFSYSLSHDMRAPLRAMEGYTQLLRNILSDKLGPKEEDFFGRIMASAERLDNLIQDVLQYSRVARAPLELKEIDLEKIVAQVISDYPNLQPPEADIRIQKPLLPVLGHEAFLTQCISNLLSNAVKFVAPGVKPKVTVSTKAYGREARLFVEDNGIGISPENQKQIFGIFQRLHPTTTYPGTGIGLAIVQKAVQRMGGRVGVESTLGKGSSFWLQLKRGGGVQQ